MGERLTKTKEMVPRLLSKGRKSRTSQTGTDGESHVTVGDGTGRGRRSSSRLGYWKRYEEKRGTYGEGKGGKR